MEDQNISMVCNGQKPLCVIPINGILPYGLIYQRNRRMPNGTYGGVRGRKTKVGRKLLRFPPTRFMASNGVVCLDKIHYLYIGL